MRNILYKFFYVLVTGSIFYIYSEKFFWSFWRTGEDDFSSTIWGIIFYSLAAYMVLYLIDRYKINNRNGLLIVGLIYGFIIEGMIAGTLFSPLLPMILLVSLPSHALVTIFLGWQYLPKLLLEQGSLKKKVIVFSGLGFLWFFWALGWFALPEAEKYSYSLNNFLIHGFALVLITPFLYYCNAKLLSAYKPTFKGYEGLLVFGTLLVFLFIVQGGTLWLSLPVIFVVAFISIWLLRKNHYNQEEKPMIIFPSSLRSEGYLFFIGMYGISALAMFFTVTSSVVVETSYIFAIPMALVTLFFLIRSILYFLYLKKTV